MSEVTGESQEPKGAIVPLILDTLVDHHTHATAIKWPSCKADPGEVVLCAASYAVEPSFFWRTDRLTMVS
jgi:hypothetical protein